MARTLYFDGDILLLDDPLSSVDPGVANRIFQHAILDARGSGKAVLMVTYDRRFLSQCDRVLCLRDGALVEEGWSPDATGDSTGLGDLDQSYIFVAPEAVPLAERSVREATLLQTEVHAGGPTDYTTQTTRRGGRSEGSLLLSSYAVWGYEPSAILVYRTYLHVARGYLSVPTLAFATLAMQTFQILGSRSLVWWQSESVVVFPVLKICPLIQEM